MHCPMVHNAETLCSNYRDFVPEHYAQNNHEDFMLKHHVQNTDVMLKDERNIPTVYQKHSYM